MQSTCYNGVVRLRFFRPLFSTHDLFVETLVDGGFFVCGFCYDGCLYGNHGLDAGWSVTDTLFWAYVKNVTYKRNIVSLKEIPFLYLLD